MSYTKSDPGCFHSMITYLSELTGLSKSVQKELIVKEYEDLFKMTKSKPPYKSKRKLRYQAQSITVVLPDGQLIPFYNKETHKRFDELGIKADHFIIRWEQYRPLDDFNIKIKNEGSYKDSLGGGWHSTVSLYSINDKYFAPQMECAH